MTISLESGRQAGYALYSLLAVLLALNAACSSGCTSKRSEPPGPAATNPSPAADAIEATPPAATDSSAGKTNPAAAKPAAAVSPGNDHDSPAAAADVEPAHSKPPATGAATTADDASAAGSPKRPAASASPSAKPAPSGQQAGKNEPEHPVPGSLASVDLIGQLHAEAKAMHWTAKTPEQYQKLQQLAHYVAAAQLAADDPKIEKGLAVIIGGAAREVLEDVSRTPWPAEAALARVNQLAAESFASEEPGLLAYVQVAFPSSDTAQIDGVPAVVFALIGTDQYIVVPVRENPPDLRRDSRWLLMGIRDPRQQFVLRIGNPDAPKRIAPLVRAKFLVGKPLAQPAGSDP